jgi:hypothetical protein
MILFRRLASAALGPPLGSAQGQRGQGLDSEG